jgi:predicted nucleic acid-binding protein
MDQGRQEVNIVLDASAALSWLARRRDAGEAATSRRAAQEVVREGALVPTLFFTEITNGLLIAERTGNISPNQVNSFLADVDALPITTDREAPESTLRAVLELARATGLTVYDATYLELALRSRSVLATFDRRLVTAARARGIPVFGQN